LADLLKRLNQPIKHHRLRLAAKIESVLKLNEIFLHVLARDRTMSAAHTAFEMRPETLNRVGARIALLPFLAAMNHRVMVIADLAQSALSRSFVRADCAALGDVLLDVCARRC
jgi:hypothetical protein